MTESIVTIDMFSYSVESLPLISTLCSVRMSIQRVGSNY
jgi:hypothetical protein